MTALEHVLERTVTIAARRETVFRFFTDSSRFAAWWGEGSTIEPRPGGVVHIRYPNGIVAGGEVVEIVPLERIVFSFGFASGQPFPAGASRVRITFEEEARGTRVRLSHTLPTAEAREAFVQGWRYQLALFANVAAREAQGGVEALADRFFAAWNEPDGGRRRAELLSIAVPEFAFRDAHSCTDGLDDLDAHIEASQRFMPGVRLERRGAARQCQGLALVDWVVRGEDGGERAKGTNAFELAPDGRIVRAFGFWG